MLRTIKVKFVKNCHPTVDILNRVKVYSSSPELYYMERVFANNQELDDFLRDVNLHPCVQLAWLK